MVYVNIDKNFFEKNKEKMLEEAKAEGITDEEPFYLFSDSEDGVIEEIDEADSSMVVKCDSTKLGYISMDVKLDTETLIDLLELAVKKLNKFKTVLEGLK